MTYELRTPMTEQEFASIDWRGMDPETYKNYAMQTTKGTDGKALNFGQKEKAKLLRAGSPLPPPPVDLTPYKLMAQHNDPVFKIYTDYKKDGNFWYFFGTFWKEMREADRAELLSKIVNEDGTQLKAGYTDLNNKEASYYNNLGPNRQEELRKLLKGMMDKGFTTWSKKTEKAPNKGMPEKGEKLLPKIDALGPQQFGVGFRGDSRDPDTLIAHDKGAFNRKVQSPFAINSYNLAQAWNPFSQDEVKNTMYWREGQADNDLFTVVSVAKNFATASKFPLLDDPPKDLKVYAQQAELVVSSDSTNARTTVKTAVSRMYVYMVAIDEGFNTEEYQVSRFPEIGVQEVKAEKFLAHMQILRLHFGPKGDDGHVVFVEECCINEPNRRKLLYAESGDGTKDKMIDYLFSTFFHQFFEYRPVETAPKLCKVVKCDLIAPHHLTLVNLKLEKGQKLG
jgi:hypothetical protein